MASNLVHISTISNQPRKTTKNCFRQLRIRTLLLISVLQLAPSQDLPETHIELNFRGNPI
uniref:Uncharacterized protein n=1 Tax=Rhizophora mucronata TaxID=61149 RepID=A0A2P2JI93_RHIMU